MNEYIIRGGRPLVGEVTISGAKNAALGILAASIMSDESVIVENLPDVSDIRVLTQAIREIGARVDQIDQHTVKINGSTITDYYVDNEYIRNFSLLLDVKIILKTFGAVLGQKGSV